MANDSGSPSMKVCQGDRKDDLRCQPCKYNSVDKALLRFTIRCHSKILFPCTKNLRTSKGEANVKSGII